MPPSILETFPPNGRDIIYLGGPYTHSDQAVKVDRYEKVTKAAAHLIEKKLIVYSPLTMTHPIDVIMAGEGETLGSDYWVAFDEAFMEHCCGMIVLQLPGWDQSSGVKREVEFFQDKGLPVIFLQPQEIGV
ncbi:DUF1937 family protein [Aurantiacibacter sp. MUD61]|uniref:DUF1937 family protein n=1 Tax=Aurantiacibacter sp. MUD61 TaxID=3009083 RepID=UPI0022F13908|nr:DUF1937 family protein [Aurantiacibacter sp. MUD61]